MNSDIMYFIYRMRMSLCRRELNIYYNIVRTVIDIYHEEGLICDKKFAEVCKKIEDEFLYWIDENERSFNNERKTMEKFKND